MAETITAPKTEVRAKPERPKLWKVILLNDDFTPRDFVVTVLKSVLRMSEGEALAVMLAAHLKGACVVAVFTKEVADEKCARGNMLGQEQGYPLTFTVERED